MGNSRTDQKNNEEMQEWPSKPLVSLEKPFVDDRGNIQPLVDKLMKSAVLIESKKGSLRANHYHKTDWHYCFVLSGEIEYFHRKTGSDGEPEMLSVKENQMVFTPPMVDHAMRFPVDTTFLTLSRNSRDQKTYEEDVVRIKMLGKEGLITWTPNDD